MELYTCSERTCDSGGFQQQRHQECHTEGFDRQNFIRICKQKKILLHILVFILTRCSNDWHAQKDIHTLPTVTSRCISIRVNSVHRKRKIQVLETSALLAYIQLKIMLQYTYRPFLIVIFFRSNPEHAQTRNWNRHGRPRGDRLLITKKKNWFTHKKQHKKDFSCTDDFLLNFGLFLRLVFGVGHGLKMVKKMLNCPVVAGLPRCSPFVLALTKMAAPRNASLSIFIGWYFFGRWLDVFCIIRTFLRLRFTKWKKVLCTVAGSVQNLT